MNQDKKQNAMDFEERLRGTSPHNIFLSVDDQPFRSFAALSSEQQQRRKNAQQKASDLTR